MANLLSVAYVHNRCRYKYKYLAVVAGVTILEDLPAWFHLKTKRIGLICTDHV